MHNIRDRSLREAVTFPSAKCTQGRPSYTRRSLPRVQHSAKSARGISLRKRRLSRETKIVHSGKAFPRAVLAFEKELTPLVASLFLESHVLALGKGRLPRMYICFDTNKLTPCTANHPCRFVRSSLHRRMQGVSTSGHSAASGTRRRHAMSGDDRERATSISLTLGTRAPKYERPARS